MRLVSAAVAFASAGLLGLGVVGRSTAATDGTTCGPVTAFAAPTAAGDGSITFRGTEEVIDQSAFGVIDPDVYTALDGVAAADETTCLTIVADAGSAIVDLSIAATAEICGVVSPGGGASEFSVDGARLPPAVVSADADLVDLLDAAASNGGSACVAVTLDDDALIATVDLNTISICDVPSVDGGLTTIGGVELGLDVWDDLHFLFDVVKIAASVDQPVCAELVIDAGEVTQASLQANLAFCGDVILAVDTPSVAGAVIDATATSAGVWRLLVLAGATGADACATVVSPGVFVINVSVTVDEACAVVSALGDGTITLDTPGLPWDVTFEDPAGIVDPAAEVGSLVCVSAEAGEQDGLPKLTSIRTVSGPDPGAGGGGGPGAGGIPGQDLLPDTAVEAPDRRSSAVALLLVVMAGAIGLAAARRLRA